MAISEKVKKRLWAYSGGFCAKPDCHAELFPFFENGAITNIEELAHIIGQKKNGPRGDNSMPLDERDEFENIVLLCPTCHTIIDKNPDLFPETTIIKWKANHESSIRKLFVGQKFNSRKEIRDYLKPLFAENKSIFENYGPFSENAKDDQLATELMWKSLAVEKILPNNRKIENVIEINQHLLEGSEFCDFIKFKLHREGFEYNKISGDVNATVPTFPKDFENIFT
jgi:hypothetical protein